MAEGVHDDETWSVLTERALNEKTAALAGGPHIQVLNGGVDSYAPILSLIELRELRGTTPDVVVEDLDVSDLVQEQTYRRMANFGADSMPLHVHAVQSADPTLTGRLRRLGTTKHLVLPHQFIIVGIDKIFHYRRHQHQQPHTFSILEFRDHEASLSPTTHQSPATVNEHLRRHRSHEAAQRFTAHSIRPVDLYPCATSVQRHIIDPRPVPVTIAKNTHPSRPA